MASNRSERERTTTASQSARTGDVNEEPVGGSEESESDADGDEPVGGEWHEVESPVEKTLYGVVDTVDGPYAVGASGNVVARSGGDWRCVVSAGPHAAQSGLRTVDVTDDGTRIWFAGSSGALGCFDVDSGTKFDHTAPEEKTSTWEAISITGQRGGEHVYVANGSGEVLTGHADEDGCFEWGDVIKPGGGSSVAAMDARRDLGDSGSDRDARCYVVDTSGNCFEATDRGASWTAAGVPDAQVNFFDIVSWDGGAFVAGGDGVGYRLDRGCDRWTPIQVGEKNLLGVARTEDGTLVASGGSGRVHESRSDGPWMRRETPVTDDLHDVSLGAVDVAVGAGGVIIERS